MTAQSVRIRGHMGHFKPIVLVSAYEYVLYVYDYDGGSFSIGR